jgi:hypothetical protein
MQIKDGVGTGYLAGVDNENRLEVYSTTETEISHESESNERAYTWQHSYDYDAGDTIILVKNTSPTKNLIIEKILISSDTTTQFVIHFPKDTTLAGTLTTGVNLNRRSNNTADAVAYCNETGNTRGVVMGQATIMANMSVFVPMDGAVILGVGNEIAVDLETAGTFGSVSIRGYYHEIE